MDGQSVAAVVDHLETALRGLLRGEHSSLHLTFNNGNGPNYMTVAEMEQHWPSEDWASDEERKRAIASNSHWQLQWYPETPVGSCSVSASSLPALLAAIPVDSTE
jgi:hypothetical protein